MKFKRLFKALMLAILTVIGIIMAVMIAIVIFIMTSKVVPLSTLNDIGIILLCIVMPFAMIVIGYYRCIS